MLPSILQNSVQSKYEKSSNKCKTTWNIIKKLTNNQQPQADVQELMRDTKHIIDQQDTADALNTYFSSIIEKISINNINNKIDNFPTFHHYLEQNHSYPPPPLEIKTFSTKEITSIIKSLESAL
jgi:hypothetical protein